jgi:hypothetical protein
MGIKNKKDESSHWNKKLDFLNSIERQVSCQRILETLSIPLVKKRKSNRNFIKR